MKNIIVYLIIVISILYNPIVLYPEEQTKKTEISILLYPFVPEYDHITKVIKSKFERKNPDIRLNIAKQNNNYYKSNGLDQKYDIYELDTIFLSDFIKSERLQSIDKSRINVTHDAFPFALKASTSNGKLYGLPHWVCALYLFYFKEDVGLEKAENRKMLIKTIGRDHEKNKGLLIDMMGTMTLAEMYLDCLLDLGLSSQEVVASVRNSVKTGRLNKQALDALKEILTVTDIAKARDDVTHDKWPPYHALEFAHARGRALVGYSERLYHILNEIKQPTDSTPVIKESSIGVKLYNQGDAKGNPLAWVDSFTLDKSLSGKKLDAAYAFLKFVTKEDTYKECLIRQGQPPMYLLPAYSKILSGSNLIKEAPLYPQFLRGLDNATGLSGEGLPETLRKIGKKLNDELPKKP